MSEQCPRAIAVSTQSAVQCKLDKGHAGTHQAAHGREWSDDDPAAGESPSVAMAKYKKAWQEEQAGKNEAFAKDAQEVLSSCNEMGPYGSHCTRPKGHSGGHIYKNPNTDTPTPDGINPWERGGSGRFGHMLFYRWKHRGARNREMKPDPDWRMPSE